MSESSMVAQGAPLRATACLKRLHRGYDKYKNALNKYLPGFKVLEVPGTSNAKTR